MYVKREEKKVHKKKRTKLDNLSIDARKRAKPKNAAKAITIEDILSEAEDAFANEYSKKSGKSVKITKGLILNSEQQQMVLTQIILGVAKDGLSGLPASIGEKIKAVEQLSKIQANEVGGDVIAEHNESIKQFELKNNGEAPDRKLEDFE